MISECISVENLRAQRFFTFFDKILANQLVESAEILSFRDGERIFNEGDVADCIYLVLKGDVRLTKKDSAGKEQMLAVIKENDYFGEFGVLDGGPRSAGAVAAGSETVLARLARDVVIGVFDAAGTSGMLKVALHIIGKVRESNERYAEERLRKERMTLVGEMASTIIHDLKNPFTIIQLAVNLLKGMTPPEAADTCDMIEMQVWRMRKMVEEILEYSRGTTCLRKANVDLAEIFEQIEKLYHDYLQMSKVRLVIEPLSVMVEVDDQKIIRVLQNLINNAVEAFAGREGTLSIKAEKHEDSIVLSVADNGPGIPPEMHACMFEPFTTMGKVKGTGLGMAIAKSIVEAHGGKLTFDTRREHGTVFFITLPLTSST